MSISTFKMQRDHLMFKKTLVFTKKSQAKDPTNHNWELLRLLCGHQFIHDSTKHLIQAKWMIVCHQKINHAKHLW